MNDTISLRAAEPEHYRDILALNRELVHFLSPLDMAGLTELAAAAALFKVALLDDQVVAFIIVLREGQSYGSVNYQWFSSRYDTFLYIDRVVVAPRVHGMGIGRLLYNDLFAAARQLGSARITAEINAKPANEGSLRFHQKMGFVEVGKQLIDDGKKQVSMQLKSLDDGPLLAAMNNPARVRREYSSSDGLGIRKALHRNYSVSEQSYEQWIKDKMVIQPTDAVLEVGCGEGRFWDDYAIDDAQLTQLDYSDHMVDTAKARYPQRRVLQGDVQALPFADQSFDVVVAIAMLYHVPSVERALSEIARVLKPGGRFYVSTHGEAGLMDFIIKHLSAHSGQALLRPKMVFTMNNGAAQLGGYFDVVNDFHHDSKLVVDQVSDLVDYIMSMESVDANQLDRQAFIAYFEAQKIDGVITIDKDYGLFVCQQ